MNRRVDIFQTGSVSTCILTDANFIFSSASVALSQWERGAAHIHTNYNRIHYSNSAGTPARSIRFIKTMIQSSKAATGLAHCDRLIEVTTFITPVHTPYQIARSSLSPNHLLFIAHPCLSTQYIISLYTRVHHSNTCVQPPHNYSLPLLQFIRNS